MPTIGTDFKHIDKRANLSIKKAGNTKQMHKEIHKITYVNHWIITMRVA